MSRRSAYVIEAKCVFRRDLGAHSGRIWAPAPEHLGHPFRRIRRRSVAERRGCCAPPGIRCSYRLPSGLGQREDEPSAVHWEFSNAQARSGGSLPSDAVNMARPWARTVSRNADDIEIGQAIGRVGFARGMSHRRSTPNSLPPFLIRYRPSDRCSRCRTRAMHRRRRCHRHRTSDRTPPQ